ncbi:MAG: Fe-S cluster assembly sulfur transfer protein SufU [Actinomycetota bacterium]
MGLDDIYKEVILDHYKRPRNKREVPGATAACTQTNPLCGDEITVAVVERDGVLAEVAFSGQGCSISQSSASMMTEATTGRDRAAVAALGAQVRRMLSGEDVSEDALGELAALQGVARYPARVKCAALAWDVLDEALASGTASGSAPH